MLNVLVILRSFIWHSDKELVRRNACFMEPQMFSEFRSNKPKALATCALLTMLFSLSGAEIALQPIPVPQRIMIRAESLDPYSFAARRVAGVQLVLKEGWALRSDSRDFGGLSALVVMPKGLKAVSDNGVFFDWVVDDRAEAWPAMLNPLPQACIVSDRKEDRDSESLAQDAATNQIWIGIEHRNLLCRMGPQGAHSMAPIAMKPWRRTGGAEAMARLADGRLLVFAEYSTNGHQASPVLLYDKDPFAKSAKLTHLSYRAPEGYVPVDAAQLPDGRLLVLHRRFKLLFRFSAILSIVSLEGKTLRGEPIAWFDRERGSENWEALAVDDEGQGKATIWMASDDNFIPAQQTFLLRLKWQGPWPH